MPTSVPPQLPAPVAIPALKFAFAATVNTAVLPWLTVCAAFGLMLPLAPALGVTV